MDWLALSYSLPSKEGSSRRVALWRRLRRMGALAIAGGVQILPAREECMEDFQWLAQEIRSANGEASVMRVAQLDEPPDQQLVKLFYEARVKDYKEIEALASDLKQNITDGKEMDISRARDALRRVRQRYTDIARIDYFDCPEGRRIVVLLEDIERELSSAISVAISVPKVDITQYLNRKWVTRPHPHVDRMACAWLIRCFIDPKVFIRYSNHPEQDEVAFDMNQGEFKHFGNLCTFEVMRLAFSLESLALRPIAEIVHEMDLHDDRYVWPEIAGIERIIRGWGLAGLSDTELESKGISLFEGLHLAFSRTLKRGNDRMEVTMVENQTGYYTEMGTEMPECE